MSKARKYHLTSTGLASLRFAAAHNKPWSKSTGPKSENGKAISRLNAFKHGERSQVVMNFNTKLKG